MHSIGRKSAIRTREIFELLVMTACLLLAVYESFWQSGSVSFENFLSMRVKVMNFFIFAGFLLAWHGLFVMFGLYRSRRISTICREIADVLKVTLAGSLILLIFGWAFSRSLLTPQFVALFWVATSVSTLVSRLAVRILQKILRVRGRNLRHLLIVGTNRRAIKYARKVESKPELGYRLVGFVENGWSGNGEFRQSGYQVVTDFKKFPNFISSHVVDEVMICLPMKSHYKRSAEIIRLCEEQGIIVRFLSDLFDLQLARSEAETVGGDPVITLRTGALQGWAILVKRGMDIVLSCILLVLAAPLLVLIALLIKLTSPGPVFFVQERVGFNKRKFRLYKFRTMVPGAEKMQKELEHLNEVSGPVFKIKNDPRITRIGKFLRKTSLDELPQLYNVLKGDMSLVGPRPPVPEEVGEYVPPHLRRLSTKPGITCLWQVNGRNSIPFDKWMELDQQYIDQWSLWLDVKILAKTVLTVLRSSGE